MHYIDTLKQELSGTKGYEQTPEKEKSVINNHIFHNATRFAVNVNKDQERLSTYFWLPKLHKEPYKARFNANSSSCRGGWVERWCWVNFQCRGVLLISLIVGQGPTALAVGAGGVVWTFFLSSIISLFFLPLSGRRPDID